MKEIITILRNLVAFKTTAENPQEIKKGFEYIASLFDSQKFETKLLEKNGKYSLLVSFKGRDCLRPNILLNGHFDVVPAEDESQYKLHVEGNRAYGRGTVDMKGMVAVLLEVMQELGKEESPPNVALLLNGDEEVGGENGAGFCVRELKLQPRFVLCADGAKERQLEITIKEKGVLWLELFAQGKTAHGAYPWLGENAIEKLVAAIEKIKKFIGPLEPNAWKSTMNVGTIEASNKTPNRVPADARAVVDIRFTEELAKTPQDLLGKIQRIVPEIEVRSLEEGSLFFVEEKNPFLWNFKRIAEKIAGREVPAVFAHGATDARYFAEAGVPCAVFGAVGDNMHSNGEWVDLKSLEVGKKILLEFLGAS